MHRWKKYWDELKRDLKPIYTVPSPDAAPNAFESLTEKWSVRYPAIIRLWEYACEEFIPYLDYDLEIRKVICSTNAIESLDARYRRAVKAQWHFPAEGAALKYLYLVTRSLDPTGKGQVRWIIRWKPRLGRIRNYLRRPIPGSGELLNENARNTVNEIVPKISDPCSFNF